MMVIALYRREPLTQVQGIMTQDKYDLVFKGQLVKGVELAVAKNNIASLFKINGAKVDAMFSGKPLVLKRGLDADAANKYRVAIKKAGALVDLVLVREAKVSGKANFAVPDSDTPAPDKAMGAIPGTIPGTSPAPNPGATATPDSQAAPQRNPAADASATPESAGLSLAPLGAEMLPATARQPDPVRSVDTSALSLRAVGGDLLDAKERRSSASDAPVSVIDFGLAEVGAPVLRAEERKPVQAVDVDISGLAMDLSEGNLAPPQPAPPAAPDVSGLQLES